MLRPGQAVALCALALLSIGAVMVHSAGLSVGDGDPVTLRSVLLSRSTVYLGLAVASLAVASLMPVDRLFRGRWQWLMPPAAIALCLLVYVPGLGREVNGAHRWLSVTLPGAGRLSIQPSEIAKWATVLFIAWWGARQATRLHRLLDGLLPALAAAGLVAGVVVLEDLGTAALIGAVAAIVLVAAGARVLHFTFLAPAALAALVGAIVVEPYRLRRITSFLDPYADPQGAGYHAIQSMVAVAGGDVTGRGLGFGVQKFGYLPEDQTDFVFAVICEEVGVAGAALTAALYICLLGACWAIAGRQQSTAHRLFGLGVIATIGLQALINLSAVTGLGPTKGIALPLVSSGGTGWVLTAGALGLLIAMDRRGVADLDDPQPSAVHEAPGVSRSPLQYSRE